MSDPVREAIHIRRLIQIKQRPNQYPTYDYNKKKRLFRSESQIISSLSTEIKKNKKNISNVKKNFKKKKPVNYDDDKYLFDREVENFQKKLVKSLIDKNKMLSNKLQLLKERSHIFQLEMKK